MSSSLWPPSDVERLYFINVVQPAAQLLAAFEVVYHFSRVVGFGNHLSFGF